MTATTTEEFESVNLICWNVNSVRTMTTACPTWKSYANILETLDADIYCFQETKLNRVGVTEEHALVPGYDAYFSFSKTKPGYSGVVTYIKQSSKLSVVDAEEGITGLLHLDSGTAKQPAAKKMRVETAESDLAKTRLVKPAADDTGDTNENAGAGAIYTQKEANELDCEGRCVIVDIGAFIIINVYVPNGANEERTAYKVRFLRAVRERTAQLEKLGRRVLVIGDINVSPQQIDHFSPSDWEADHDNVPYDKEPGRVFLREWNLSKEQLDQGSAESGHVVDLFRYFYPDRKDAFTCWSPFQRHRERNMGYRIDLALATPNLVQMAADSDIMPKTFGSDHIPISVKFNIPRSVLESYKTASVPAPLCAKFYLEFTKKQQRLTAFFTPKPKTAASATTTTSATASKITGVAVKRRLGS